VEVNVILLDDNRDNLRHMVDYLKDMAMVRLEEDIITFTFHKFQPESSRDDPTRIDIEETSKKLQALKPGVAIIDVRLEGDASDDYSGH